ncbi:MAG: thioesterase II family protein [Actinocrinis sp.]
MLLTDPATARPAPNPADPRTLIADTDAWFPDVDFAATAPPSTPSPSASAPSGAPLNLICLPYAGGTPSIFRGWAAELGPAVHLVPVLLPGRGLRSREQPYTAMRPLAEHLAAAIAARGLAVAGGYALFGHSMGALVAYEVACELRRLGFPEPAHLFVSGSKAPHLYADRGDHRLTDPQLRRLVRDLGGLGPDEQVGEAYLQHRLPVLRADLSVCERYRWTPRPPLRCPATALCATGDPIATAAQVEAWREHTTGSLLRRDLPGNHFYLTGPARPLLLAELRRELHAPVRPRTGVPADLSGRNST